MMRNFASLCIVVGFILINYTPVLALPSEVSKDGKSFPAHGDIANMAAEIKYDRNDDGLRLSIDKVFKTKDEFVRNMRISSIAEDKDHFYNGIFHF